MCVALWQGRSPEGDTGAAVDQAVRALHAAAAMGAAVLVLPEVWLPGYNRPDLATRALRQDDPAMRRLAQAARGTGCAVVVGHAEATDEGVYNASTCIGPDGTFVATYRKLQLYGPRERSIFHPGAGYAVFDLGGRRTAMLICYDVEFAPHVAALAAQGVELILAPTANMQPFVHVVRHTVPAMAANHGVSIVYANYCGIEGDLTYVGGSLIAGPHGEVLAQAGDTPALLVAELPARDPARLSTQAIDLRTP
ncbi:MAG: nitrilase [Paracoccaceae bacterium]|nr:MAG: nitrilase [Paracoccaceae bacterium]